MSNSHSKSFWTSLPGILTGVAAVVAAITGLYVALSQQPSTVPPDREVEQPSPPSDTGVEQPPAEYPQNSPPFPTEKRMNLNVKSNEQRTVIFGGSDDDGDSLNVDIITEPEHGKLIGPEGAWNRYIYQASGGEGTDVIEYRISDGKTSSDPAAVFITVTP